jgi:hypothetical protein
MSRSLSPEFISEIFAQESSDPFLMLLTIEHSSFSTIRLVANGEDVVSRSQTYTAFPFNLTLPVDDGETQQQVSLSLDNVGLDLIEDFRSITTPPTCKLEMVLASNPDVVEVEIPQMKMLNINYDAKKIRSVLALDDILNTQIPGEKYEPTNFRGLFT